MSALAAASTPEGTRRWAATLAAAVRPEFNVERYQPGLYDPALGRM